MGSIGVVERELAGVHQHTQLAVRRQARRLAQDVALAVQASLLAQTAPAAVADAFCASRLGGDWGFAFGTLGTDVAFKKIVERAWAA